MRSRRFFAADAAPGRFLVLSSTEAHHLRDVLRLSEGVEIEILNGLGEAYKAQVVKIEKDTVRVHVLGLKRREPRLDYHLEILIPLLKGGRTEFLIEKAVELGVPFIHLFYGEYGVRKPSEKVFKRFQERAIQSLKQCGRLWLPEITFSVSLEEALSRIQAPIRYFAYEKGGNALVQVFRELPPHLALVSGPEGGFSSKEVDFLKKRGFLPLSLGPYVLRAETAAFFLMSIWRFELLKVL